MLPGVARTDLCEAASIGEVLKSAADSGLKDIAIVGRALNGEIVVWGNQPDADNVVGLLMRGATWLASTEQETTDTDIRGSQ